MSRSDADTIELHPEEDVVHPDDVVDDWDAVEPDDVEIAATAEDVRSGWRYPYKGFEKQQLASSYLVDEMLFGGAAGPGKTDWILAELVNLCLAVPNGKALLLRNTYGELQEEILPRLESRIPPWVGKYSSKLRAFVFFNGARLRLGYLERDDDKRHYIGAEYMAIGFDELTLLPWTAYQFLGSRVRATGEIKKQLDKLGIRPRRMATSNPGGPYHMQVKGHFVDPAAPGKIVRSKRSGLTRVYVPATIGDNPAIGEEYRRQLMELPADKRKALLEGSWDILEGVRFEQWNRNHHVIDPEMLPLPELSGERCIAVDYGFAAQFAALWMIKLGNGLVIVYRELYATGLTATQQAELIRKHTPDDEWALNAPIVADPAMWGRRDAAAPKTHGDAPPVSSPAHDYQTALRRTPIKARNDRVLGWARIDEHLRVRDDGFPRLLVYSNCVDTIRTLPTLLRSKSNPEDVSSSPKQEDHIADTLRYGLMRLDPKDPTVRARHGSPRQPSITAGIMTRKW